MSAATAIIDTNVVVSGLLTDEADAATRRLVDAMLDGTLRFYLSVELLSEYRRVLLRSKIRKLHGLSDEEIDGVLEAIALEGIFRDPPASDLDAPDSDDQHLWELAEETESAIVVTGDGELLDEAPGEFSVLSPRKFLDLLDLRDNP